MNLTIDPWVPALRAAGRRELFSLQDLFARAHELRDLAVRPHERIALMRLLLCITQAALNGPEDEDEWVDCQPRIQPAVRDYLEKWKAAFELFGEGERFLQFTGLKPGKDLDDGNAATKLDLTLATGNNSTLFDNVAGAERSLPSARCAMNLLAFQCFSPSGRIGVAKWNGKDTAGNGSSNHAPATPLSMVHTFVLGANLLETLHKNLLSKEAALDEYGQDRWGMPVWENRVMNTEAKTAVANAIGSYLGRLVPLSRAIRLRDGGQSMILANGLDYPTYPAFREATATVIVRKDERALLPASTSRGFWRQLAAISVLRRAGADTGGPLALNHVSSGTGTTLWVGALVTDKAKIEEVVESTYSLPPGMFSEAGRAAYERGVAYAEERERVLIQAVKTHAASLKVVSPAYDQARQHFWTRVEQYLSDLLELPRNTNLVTDLPNSTWGQAVRDAAFDAYEQTCPRQTPRQIEAYALGLRKLTYRPKAAQPTVAADPT